MKNDVHLGHKARKRFGQNFLNDPYVIDGIVSAINPLPGQNLVEIGPGLGAITEPVGKEVDKFTVIELDRDLAERLRTHPDLSSKLTIHEGDAMRFDFTQLIKPNNKLRIFGNLPYNISTPLMFHLFDFHADIKDMHFMLQKEDIILRHCHPNQKRSINTTSEVIVVQSGTLEVDIYDKNHEFVDSFELNEGDIGILIDGGHGIKIIEDCKFVEVKQGPYDEKTDKVRF